MRKAKGELQLTRIKIEETEIEAELKKASLQNKALTSIQQITLLQSQLSNTRGNIQNMRLLLDAEREKFTEGESSVFLINMREQQLFDLRLQEIEISAQLKLAEIDLLYLLGEL
jgi:outer membrane protein TolC